MKVILDLEKYTVEYLETTPFIQGTDSRNKIEVLVPHESTTNVMIAYTLASGRSTIAMANKSLTTITYNSASYDNVLFELPSTVTRLEGNICATVIVTLASDSTKHKFNILNTILNSTDFETFEDALTGIAAQVIASLAAMNSNVNATATALNNHKNATNNPHSVTKAQVGLGNCNNTSDKDKPISDATQAALDHLQDEIDDLGVIAEMPDKIIDVANCFDFTNNKDKVTVDEVETKELKVNNYEDPYNTSFSVDGNGINAHQNDDEDHYAEFEISGPSLATLAAFKFKWGSEFGDNVITLLDIVNMAQGKTRNYVIDLTATGINITNFEFDTTSNAMTLNLLDDGNENKIKLVNNNIVSLKDLKIGDIVSVTQSEVPDRWVGNITSTQITFYSLETKTDSTPTEDSGYPISSGAIWNIIKNAANANTWYSENTFNGTTELHDVRVDDELFLSDNVELNVQNFTKIKDRDKTLQDSLDQNLYHLGSFDSKNGNVITRQTGYVDLGTLNYQLLGSDYSHYFLSNTTIQNIDTTSREAVCSIYTINNVAYNNMLNMQIRIESNGQITIRNDSYDATTTSGLNAFKGAMSGVILQYKLATSYTETIIENQPLITLDQKGSEWLRNEWEKGLNIWDEQWELGALNVSDGSGVSSPDCIRNKGYIEVKPNTIYHISSPHNLRILFYDASKTYIDYFDWHSSSDFTTPATTNYIRFYLDDAYGNTYQNNIMLNEGDHAYPYQAYNGAIVHEKDIAPVLLWENGNPTSALGSGNVTTLSNSNYKYLIFAYKIDYASSKAIQYIKVDNELYRDIFICATNNSNSNYTRVATILSSTSVAFTGGFVDGASDDTAIIPIAIYGTNVL